MIHFPEHAEYFINFFSLAKLNRPSRLWAMHHDKEYELLLITLGFLGSTYICYSKKRTKINLNTVALTLKPHVSHYIPNLVDSTYFIIH